jgi:hypothetical protein
MKPEAYAALFYPGARAEVNGSGDLMMVREDGKLIGKTVTIVKRCKSGLLLVDYEGHRRSLPQRNLTPVTETP